MTSMKTFISVTFIGIFLLSGCKKDDDNITVTDGDGNVYKTVKIDTQEWLVENLKTTKYNDGTAIPLVTDKTAWAALTTPAYCLYNNDEASNKATYGALYNWYAVQTGKLCPIGWHIPSNEEWIIMTTYLGGESVAGDKLKEKGTTYWQSVPGSNSATNESGFTALPGGQCSDYGNFAFIGVYGFWWNSNEYNSSGAWYIRMSNGDRVVRRSDDSKNNGFSVRCIKD